MRIRPALAEERDAVASLWAECGLVAAYNDPGADFEFARGRENSDVLLGLDDAGGIASSIMVGHDGHRGWLYYLASRPDQRGQGRGRAMIAAAEHWLVERGIAKVHLLVRESNTQVVPFYQRLGFAVAPRVMMEKWIDASPRREV